MKPVPFVPLGRLVAFGVAVLLVSLIARERRLPQTSPSSSPKLVSPTGALTTPSPTSARAADFSWEMTTVAENLEVPWDLAFGPEGELYLTERSGRIKVLERDARVRQLATLPQVHAQGESGLTGLALDPDFGQNRLLYLYYTFQDKGGLFNRVSRFLLTEGGLKEEIVILDRLPGGAIHNGGRLRFGPDGLLWVLTGDGGRAALAQDGQSLGGKILRLNRDGSVPSDNPTAGSLVYSFGHRNPQGLAWHPLTGELIATEHGEKGQDEINRIVAGGNYGWPQVKECDRTIPGLIKPIACSGQTTWAPSGATFLNSPPAPFGNSFFFVGLRGARLERLEIKDGEVIDRELIIEGQFGRLRALTPGPDGALYASTSNRDGRGIPRSGDDRIIRLKPVLRQ